MMILDKDRLAERLKIGMDSVTKATTLRPEFKMFRLYSSNGKLFLEASDIEQGMRAVLLEEDVEELDVLIDADKFFRFVSMLSSDLVRIKVLSTQIVVTAGSAEMKFATAKPTDFPELPQFPEDGFFVAPDFQSKVGSVVPFLSMSDARSTFRSVYIDSIDPTHLKLVTVDGTRATTNVVETLTPMEDEFRVLVPAKILKEFVGYGLRGQMQIGFVNNKFMIKVDDIELMVGVMADKFPDVSSLFKKPWDEQLTFQTKEALKAVKMVAIVAKEHPTQENAAKFHVEALEGVFDAISQDGTMVQTRFPLDEGGTGSEHGIDVKKLEQVLSLCPELTIRYVMKEGKNSSWGCKNPNDSTWDHVVMPMNLK